MKIYVASALKNYYSVLHFERELRAAGHEISFSWATEYKKQVKDPAGVQSNRGIAERCRDGVLAADVLFLWAEGKSRGQHIEYGIAIGAGKKLVVLDASGEEHPTSFYLLATILPNLNAVREHFGIK